MRYSRGMKRASRGKKLLVASLGVAAMVYACQRNDGENERVGNLVAPDPPPDGGFADPPPPDDPPEEPVGNLVAPPPEAEEDAG